MPRPYARANSDSIQSPTSSLAHTLSPRSKRSHHTAPSPRPCACTWPCAAQRPYPSGWGHYPQRSGSSGCGIFIIRPPPRAGSLGSSECRVIGILRVRDPQGAESSSFDPLRVQGHWDPQGAGSSGCGILRVRGWSVQRLHRSEAWTACARFWGAPENTRADMFMVYNLHRCVLFHMI